MRQLTLVVVASFLVVTAAGIAVGAPAGTAAVDGHQETAASVAAGGPSGAVAPASPAADGSQASDSEAETDEVTDACSGDDARPDPSTDQLGWEDGCWYDDPVSVDRSDGLNDTEMAAVVSRAMARVEQIRELEFQKRVPVSVISRETFVEQNSKRYEDMSTAARLHQNAKWEAMFMVNESADAVEVQQRSFGASVLGYYSPTREEIVIVSENTTSPKMDEITLSQELFHALQDQQFDLSSYNQSTQELHNAKDGIIEGDGNFVDYLYEQRCDAGWDCLEPSESGGGGGDVHAGMLVTQFVPYSEGPELVQEVYQRDGWEAVNEMYENPPASTEQIIHHDKYGTDPPTEVTIDHSTSDGWQVLQMENGLNYAQFGEGGLYAMLWYASYEASVEAGQARTVGIPYRDLFQYKEGSNELRDIGPYNYDHPATAGWEGDKLVPYVKGDATSGAQMGYVWKIQWETADDADEFLDAYRNVLSYHGAEPVDERANTWRIPDDEEFGDAFYVVAEGSTVLIVNAPSVTALSDVHAGAGSVDTATPTPTPTPGPDTDTETPTVTATPTPTETPETTTTTSPGFGLLAEVVALLALGALARRSR